METKDLKPKLLEPEEIVNIFLIYNLCGEIFEGSNMLKLFQHIAALSMRVRELEAKNGG